MKKPVVAFITYDESHKEDARKFKNSLRKFHSEEELPLVEICGEDIKKRLAQDPHFFYRQKPIIASELMYQYETVIGFDIDQLVCGDLKHLWEDADYDVGTVLNFNPTDFKQYGPITTYIIDCTKYFNCGLVAMRSKAFIEHWKKLCFQDDIFLNLQYREQDILNILCKFGLYNVKCFDAMDEFETEHRWHGIVAKGEGLRMKLINNEEIRSEAKVILPKSESGYPNTDILVKLYHWGGPVKKFNYRVEFNEDLIKHFDYLVGDKK